MRSFLFFFCAQACSYGFLTWNYRSIAQARYANIFVSDMFCAAVGYALIKHVAGNKSKAGYAGYVLGGACGSILSAWVTKMAFGQ